MAENIVRGIFVGRQIDAGLYAEPMGDGRWLVRHAQGEAFPRRVGEVFGGRGRFQAFLMNGDRVAATGSLLEAARSLVS